MSETYAIRRPLAFCRRARTMSSALAHGGATEIGESRLKPTMASSIIAASSARAGQRPVHLAGIPGERHRRFGVSPGVGRMPTMPQNAAGMRIEQPKSVPCASGTMPVATATAEPPDEPAGLSAGFQDCGSRRTTSLTVLAPVANSGVLVLPSTIAPAALQPAHDLGVLVGHEILVERRAEGGADARGERHVLDDDRQAMQRPERRRRA